MEEIERKKEKDRKIGINEINDLFPLSKQDVLRLIEKAGSPDKLNLGFKKFTGDFDRINLKGAKLYNTIFKNVNFEEANLEGVDFSYAHLPGVNLENANLQHADLTGANLSFDIYYYKGYKDSIKYSNSYLSQLSDSPTASLINADLRYANMERTLLFGVDLRGANLEGANLREAKMGEVYTSKFVGYHKELYISESSKMGDEGYGYGTDRLGFGTDLRGTKVTETQLRQTQIYKNTILPNGKVYRPPMDQSDLPRSSWPFFSKRYDK